MRGRYARFVTYRDAVTDLMRAGEPFDEVEDVIDDLPGVTIEEKDALWLLAFSLRERPGRELSFRPLTGAE
jgi:hypothetical protein